MFDGLFVELITGMGLQFIAAVHAFEIQWLAEILKENSATFTANVFQVKGSWIHGRCGAVCV